MDANGACPLLTDAYCPAGTVLGIGYTGRNAEAAGATAVGAF